MKKTDRKLIILTGPTGVGKTSLSLGLAKAIGGEIISADSIAVYKHFDIGSAKIKPEEMQGIRHHLIDVMEPREPFAVAEFKQLADRAIEDVYGRGHIPILVGGTGFYIQAVLRDVDFSKENDDGYRKMLEETYRAHGAAYMHEWLQRVDADAAAAIHENNVKRVIRALEFYHQSGMRISEHNENESQKENAYNAAYFVLTCDRQKLYARIEERIDAMLADGLVDEVQMLVRDYGVTKEDTSMQGLGYKELLDYINGACTYDEAVYKIKRDTRHFAKRQLTWFRRERDVVWVDKDVLADEDAQLAFMLSVLRDKNITGPVISKGAAHAK